MSKKRLLSIVISAVILLSFACTAMAVEKSERYVGDSTMIIHPTIIRPLALSKSINR